MEAQRVMVIQDASKEVCSSAIKWVLQCLVPKPGDLIVLLGVLHQVNDPTTVSVKGTRKLLRYRKKVDSSSKFAANHGIVDKEAARKEEFENNAEILEISKLCKAEKIEFRIEVTSGVSPAFVAMQSAEILKATWVILDRKMKKKKKIFLEKLTCGISSMKKNNSIKLLRGPRTIFSVTYDDTMPRAPEEEDLFSIELFPPYTEIRLQAEETFGNPECSICDNNKSKNTEWRKDFAYVELHGATDGFSSKNNLSEVDVECTFRGQLQNKLNVVIKSAKNNMFFQEEPMKFKSEIDKFSRVRHENLVMLLGCCAEGTHRLLVYEYVCNGSLDQHLSSKEKLMVFDSSFFFKYPYPTLVSEAYPDMAECQPMPLSWTKRVKVAVGASRGLNHLHQNNIIHKNIRSSNILLNHDFEPLLGDFGQETMGSKQCLRQMHIQTSKYLAPEHVENGTVSTLTDVFSFGVVLLELITGQRSMDKELGQQGFLKWARTPLKQRRYLELVDPRIADSHDVFQLYRMAQLAHKCLSKNPNKRLPMDKVVSTLKYIAESKASSLQEDDRPSKSKFADNCVKTMEHESCYEEEEEVDVESKMKSRSFSANLWRCRSFGTSFSDDGKSFRFMRAIRTRKSSSQMHYGKMLD